jgi:hypothetical protein
MNSEITKLAAVVVRSCDSPSPRTSPTGRGRIIRRLFACRRSEFAGREFATLEATDRCSLSPGALVSTQIGKRPVFKAFLPLLLTQEGGEGRGEEALYLDHPSLRLSPRSFLAGRECQIALAVTHLSGHILPIIKHRWYHR